MKISDLTWAAGFLEGEGFFHAAKKQRGNISLGANQVQKEPLERLQALFGGTFRRRLYNQKNPRWSDQWAWQLQGSAAVGVMMTLYCFMSPRRKEQIKVTLERWKTWAVAAKHKTYCKKGHILDSIDCRGRRRCLLCTREKWKVRAREDRAKERQDKVARGEALPVHKRLTDAQVLECRTRVCAGELTQAAACREYGLSPAGMHKLLYGKLRADVGGPLLTKELSNGTHT